MKATLLITFFWILSYSTIVGAQPITFQNMYIGNPGDVSGRDFKIIQTHDNGYMFGGLMRLIKCNENGSLEWMKDFNNPIRSFYGVGMYDNNQGYLASGNNCLIRLDTSFIVLWLKEYIPLNTAIYTKEIKNIINGFLLAGSFALSSWETFYLMQIDTVGDVQWAKKYSVTFNGDLNGVYVMQDNGYIICGHADMISPQTADAIVFRTDSLGNSIWCKQFNSSQAYLSAKDIIFTHDSAIVVAGEIGGAKSFIAKLDTNGNTLWIKQYESQINLQARSLIESDDYGFIVTGMVAVSDSMGFRETATLFKIDTNGNIQWSRIFDNYGYIQPSCLIKRSDGGFAISSTIAEPGGGIAFSVITTDSLGYTSGCNISNLAINVSSLSDTGQFVTITDSVLILASNSITPVFSNIGSMVHICGTSGIHENEEHLNNIKIIPNPSPGYFTCYFEQPLPENSTLNIVDAFGRNVYSLSLDKGFSEFEVEIPKISTGNYLIKIDSDNHSFIKKHIITER